MLLKVGNILKMKKPHPCGGRDFLVLRVGSDIKIKCVTCTHEVIVERVKLEKSIKNIEASEK